MTAHTRADLESLPGYVPGRSIPGAVKLASNEVSVGPLPGVVAAIRDAAAGINRYPDNGAAALVDRLAARLDVPPSQLAVGAGSVALCQQLVQATCTPTDEVLFAWRSFEAYPIITQIVGARQRTVPLRTDHTHDLAGMLDAITPATRLVFVCNPNNPTGTAVRRDELVTFLDAVPDGVLVALDEAYHEFVTDPAVPDGMELYRQRENVAVLRTFSKAYGLAALRVGYCVAPEPVATTLRKVSVPFSINSLAQVAALASLDVEDEMLARCRSVAAERDRVGSELIAMGYPVPRSQANFVWLPFGEHTMAFNEHCLEHKVVIRPFSGDGVRITIGDPNENEMALAAAREWRNSDPQGRQPPI
ncbi:MAG: histidinol-phosphate aminotransferase [Pseudonocardiales bacterium]|jgi:histidinol-phosphate aminotransferase|nr:histidinol-phosphate aminotransferase [Pseudonocardiales bacterium]